MSKTITIKKGTILKHNEITSEETYTKPSIYRYTEASLIKKLENDYKVFSDETKE